MSRRRRDPRADLFEEILIRYMERGVRDQKYDDRTLNMMYYAHLIIREKDPISGLETIKTGSEGMDYLHETRCRFPRVKHMIRYKGTASRWSA
ncbi:MAG: hypothetical protein Q4Q58_05290 [Thermoplasmata archaeon]|nr:hypothetical protein [Thermoplasmata archaeon]